MMLGLGAFAGVSSVKEVRPVEKAEAAFNESMFFVVDGTSGKWLHNGNDDIWIHIWNGTVSNDYKLDYDEDKHTFSKDVTRNDYTSVIIVRQAPNGSGIDWDDCHNLSNDLNIASGNNTFTVTDLGNNSNKYATGSWSCTEPDETVRIWLDRDHGWEKDSDSITFHYWSGNFINKEISPSSFHPLASGLWLACFDIPLYVYTRGLSMQFKGYYNYGSGQSSTPNETATWQNGKIYKLGTGGSMENTPTRVTYTQQDDDEILGYVLEPYKVCDSSSYYGYEAYDDLVTVWDITSKKCNREQIVKESWTVDHTVSTMKKMHDSGGTVWTAITADVKKETTYIPGIVLTLAITICSFAGFLFLKKKKEI